MTIVTSPYRVQPGDKLKHWPTAVKALYRDEADDLAERALWPQYVQACRDMLEATSSKQAPWYVVPADDKRNARLIVSQVVVEALAALKMSYPEPEVDAAALKRIREQLSAD